MAKNEASVTSDSTRPWYEAFPPSSLSAAQIPALDREEVLAMLKSTSDGGREYLLIDVRRADHEGGQIRGSLNVPAQSMYYTRPTLYWLFKNSNLKLVIWFCGSSHGRGPRCAGWFHDYCQSQGDNTIRNVVLAGGIKGWAAAGPEYIEWMDGYDASAWTAPNKTPQ